MNSVYNKNILILGATEGMSREFAVACAREKANIIALDHRKEPLAELEREIGNMKANIRTYSSVFPTVKALEQTLKDIYRNHDKIDFMFTGGPRESENSMLKADIHSFEKFFFFEITVPSVIARFVFEKMLQLKEAGIAWLPPLTPGSSRDGIFENTVNQAWTGLFTGLTAFAGKSKCPVSFINVSASGTIKAKPAAAALLDAVLKNKSEVKL